MHEPPLQPLCQTETQFQFLFENTPWLRRHFHCQTVWFILLILGKKKKGKHFLILGEKKHTFLILEKTVAEFCHPD